MLLRLASRVESPFSLNDAALHLVGSSFRQNDSIVLERLSIAAPFALRDGLKRRGQAAPAEPRHSDRSNLFGACVSIVDSPIDKAAFNETEATEIKPRPATFMGA